MYEGKYFSGPSKIVFATECRKEKPKKKYMFAVNIKIMDFLRPHQGTKGVAFKNTGSDHSMNTTCGRA